MPQTIQPAVVGATGYAGFELARLLARHPHAKKPVLFTRNGEAGTTAKLDELYPHVSGNGGYPMEPFRWETLRAKGVNVLFLATPHEISREWVPKAIAQGVHVIDLSGAWRLETPEYRAIYEFKDQNPAIAAQFMAQAVYGIPELHRNELKEAVLVANAGCYATSIILALAPLVRAGLVDLNHGVVCDSKSGVSGAGKQPTQKTHFVEVAENFSAYSVFNHRHTGEILEQLGILPEQLIFTPHLLPIPRGILSTIYVRLNSVMTAEAIEGCMRKFYADSTFVRIFPAGKLPQIQYSLHTNYCDVGFTLAPDCKRLVMVSCLDNLVKGAAGQAVQNMNVMFGWNEEEGLR
ncbi:MAG TPA: N-acetyl-gamma-glutamyl-phosphate reductase [Candidatus Polarisedimenticolia bacterium]|nr:N-acetyl-gamma-glutamyl-phosphate reductase [Candidatus Polarisedimenticolia bacterium]